MRSFQFLLAVAFIAWSTVISPTAAQEARLPVVKLAENGRPQLPIVAGSVAEPSAELKQYLDRITGGSFEITSMKRQPRPTRGIFVGVISDFPEIDVENVAELGSEGFVIRTRENRLYLVGHKPRGTSHAVVTLLSQLGCRWFFPGEAWEVIPQQKTVTVSLDTRQTPSFPTQRRIWYGFGAYRKNRADWEEWMRHNRMGSPIRIGIGHSWAGLQPEKDFEKHPEWFALVDGKRQPSKPCYSHPQVIDLAVQSALAQAKRGSEMISMTPPDGLGYCECERCKAAAGVVETFTKHNTLFGKRKDGTLVNVTSETVFGMVNRVAAAVAAKYPNVHIGSYAYSAYSHPPSFDLHKNVYLQTTTAYRRTPLTLTEQLNAFGKKTHQLGIREYYSVYQWDWDYPDPGKLTPGKLKEDLAFFHQHGVTAVNAEASCNWGPRGLGYYLAANLLWHVEADTDALVRDFYVKAFGPAARAMQRYYVRWYGEDVAVLEDSEDLPQKCTYRVKRGHDLAALKGAYRDLTRAAELTAGHPKYRARVDQLRMYAHYLLLRHDLQQAAASGSKKKLLAAIEAETRFCCRLVDTGMVHTRPLAGKAFLRRFRAYKDLLADVPRASQSGQGWRKLGTPPDAAELEALWKADLAQLGMQ